LIEAELLKKPKESAKDYMARIAKQYAPPKKEPESKAVAPKPQVKDELQKLQDCLDILKTKELELQTKIDSLASKLMNYRLATQEYMDLNNQWNDKSAIAKFFIWILSWFKKDTILHQITVAQEKCDQATFELNNEFAPYKSAGDYQTALKIQLSVTSSEHEDTKKHIEKVRLERFKEEIKQQVTINAPMQTEVTVAPPVFVQKAEPVPRTKAYLQSKHYSLFSEYMPSTNTMLAAGVAVAAVVYENYFRSP
jgi:hypothetical protein